MEFNIDNRIKCIESSDCRDRSYDLCRQFFIANWKNQNQDKKNELALNLYAYLASWGMLRNSFSLVRISFG